MSNRINKKELAARLAGRTGHTKKESEDLLEAVLEEIYDALKKEESVSLRHFGTFYIDKRSSGTVFKFNPSQRLRALFGWSSSYKGDL